jgi:hypothetical protein
MSEKTFIPSGPSFIGNVQAGQQFNANVISTGPTRYFRITNGGTSDPNSPAALWVALQANTTAPATMDFAGTSDPAWAAKHPGTYVGQEESVIVSIANGDDNKSANPALFMANIDVASAGTYAVFIVQPVIPV